jgi:DNA-binding beta-propeller fold protein YncE
MVVFKYLFHRFATYHTSLLNMQQFYRITRLLFIPLFCFIFNQSKAQVILTVAGAGEGDGSLATSASLNFPFSVAVDGSGNIYVADHNNNRVRMINTSGIISTIAGTGHAGYFGDGGQATAAELNSPSGLVLDASGNLYISDGGNNCIRKVSTSGIISTYAETETMDIRVMEVLQILHNSTTLKVWQ